MPGRDVSVVDVALPVPLRRCFAYLLPAGAEAPPVPGVRVRVPFGSRRLTGMVMGPGDPAAAKGHRLKRISEVLDEAPLFPEAHLKFLKWAADYYQHPLGEVIFNALPTRLRQGKAATATVTAWSLTAQAADRDPASLARSPRQRAAIGILEEANRPLTAGELEAQGISRRVLNSLREGGWIEAAEVEPPAVALREPVRTIELNSRQLRAIGAVSASMGRFRPFLLNGVTGSGKTEVYLELMAGVVERRQQALVLVPEIGLTPQFVARVRQRIPAGVVTFHSALSEGERLAAWLEARDGRALVILGTRSAVWLPLARPGLVIVDEEHDPSYKQQDGLRYSARDIAIVRARDAGVPVVLGSATPSMESLHNAHSGRYAELRLPERAGGAVPPAVHIVDLRGQEMHGALGHSLVKAMEGVLAAGQQTILFLNRRGYAPMVLCHTCGWFAACRRCEVALTFHRQRNQLLCHHCGLKAPPVKQCGECGSEALLQMGHGTERLAETLAECFPGARILRIDRDSTRAKGAMDRIVETIHAGGADILIGTQMLAKGHHFPKVTLVGIVDADRGLFSADFRAAERMAQLLMQVSGRAGRAEHPGQVLIQTHHPGHPLLRALLDQGYDGFAELTLKERAEAELPPFSYLAMLRAEHLQAEAPKRFLEEARDLLKARRGIRVFGPMPALMERRAGRYRYQLLLQASSRGALAEALRPWAQRLEELPSARRVRWSLDVDPQEMI